LLHHDLICCKIIPDIKEERVKVGVLLLPLLPEFLAKQAQPRRPVEMDFVLESGCDDDLGLEKLRQCEKGRSLAFCFLQKLAMARN
jgi:hypothetical protein